MPREEWTCIKHIWRAHAIQAVADKHAAELRAAAGGEQAHGTNPQPSSQQQASAQQPAASPGPASSGGSRSSSARRPTPQDALLSLTQAANLLIPGENSQLGGTQQQHQHQGAPPDVSSSPQQQLRVDFAAAQRAQQEATAFDEARASFLQDILFLLPLPLKSHPLQSLNTHPSEIMHWCMHHNGTLWVFVRQAIL